MGEIRRYAEWQTGMHQAPKVTLIHAATYGWVSAFIGLLTTAQILDASSIWFTVFLSLGGLSYILLITGIAVMWRSQRYERPYAELLEGPPSYPVTIQLAREVNYGSDEGLITFADGWLTFAGPKVQFSLRAEDIEPDLRHFKRIWFDGPHGRHSLRIRTHRAEFWWAFDAWLNRRNEGTPGITVLPPVRPMPTNWQVGFQYGIAVMIVVLGLVSIRPNPWAGGLEILFGAAFACIQARTGRTLGRLERNEPPAIWKPWAALVGRTKALSTPGEEESRNSCS